MFWVGGIKFSPSLNKKKQHETIINLLKDKNMGILLVILIALIIIIALICGVIVELFWPIVAIVAAYYLIKWLQKESNKGN